MTELTERGLSFQEFYEKIVLSKYYIRYVNPELLTKKCMDLAENDLAIVRVRFPQSDVAKHIEDI